MKKVFTLIAGFCLFASGAFAQEKWTNMVLNGSMEGEADPSWSSFWCHDYRTSEEVGEIAEGSGQQWDDGGQFQGFAEIVEDPDVPGNHCARVKVRSQAEAEEAGNMVVADGNLASWDCQFFIYSTEVIPEGKEVRMTLRVKGEKAGKFETQAHWAPGDYNHWQMFGDVNYTTDWQTIEVSTTVSADQAKEGDGKYFQSVAFNLSTMTDGNVVYFDDVKLEVRDKPEPKEFSGWFNFLRKGTMTNDPQQNFTTFTGRDGMINQDLPARIVDDPLDGEPALCVTTIAYDYYEEDTQEVEQVDPETGEVVIDPDSGEPIMETVTTTRCAYTDSNGQHVGVKVGDDESEWSSGQLLDWQTQFFVTVPHKFVPGQPYKLKMMARADADVTIDTQTHIMPGGYVHWNFCGSLNLTPDWQEFEFGGDPENPALIPNEASGGCQTIAFNCNKEKNTPVNIYFRFEEFSFNEADVQDNERVLGTSSVTLPVGAEADSEVKASIDVSEALEVLEREHVTDFDVAVQGEEEFSTIGEGAEFDNLTFDVGIFIDQNGWWTLSETDPAVDLELDTDKSNVDVLHLNVINMNGITIEPGKTIDTKIAFQNRDGWRYLYNVSLMNQDTYTAIDGVETAPAVKNGVIYDLMGRKTTAPVKGLYIKDGKKYLVK